MGSGASSQKHGGQQASNWPRGSTGYPSPSQTSPMQPSAPPQSPPGYGGHVLIYPPQQYPHQAPVSGFHPQPPDQSLQDWDPPEQWDTKRDMIYTRVLSADEFLGRMEETDEKVRMLSSTEDRSQHLKRIADLMGLRGHLQDELLRIEAMLVEDDPELKCLEQFEQRYPKAVLKLRELKVKKEEIKLSTQDTEVALVGVTLIETSTGTSPHTTSTSTGTGTTSSSSSSIGVGTTAGQGKTIGVQSDSEEQEGKTVGITHVKVIEQCIDEEDEEKVDDALKMKHDEEENYVSQKFAEKLSRPRNDLSQEDVDRVLNDHLLSMQALRNKQKLEKKKVQDMLELKKRQRLLTRRAQKQDDEEEEEEEELKKQRGQREGGRGRGTGLEEHQVGAYTMLTTPVPNKVKGKVKPTGTATIMRPSDQKAWHDSSDECDSSVSPGRGEKGISTSDLDSDEDLSASYSDDFDSDEEDGQDKEDLRTTLKEDLWQKLGRPRKSFGKVDIMGHLEAYEEEKKRLKKGQTTDSSVGTEELLQDISEMDEEFVQKLLREDREMSDEEFAQLLKRHLSGVNELRKQRQSEKDRLKDKLRAKMKNKKKQADDLDSEEDSSFGTFTSTDSPSGVSIGTDAEETELDEEISRLDAAFQADLLSSRKRMTDNELKEFFEKHRQERENLIKKQQSDRQDIKNKMKAKLAAKVNKKKSADLSKKSNKKLLGEEDDKFFQDLQRLKQKDELSEDVFAEMLQSFLDEKEKNKKQERRKKQQDEDVSRSLASDIVHQHQQNSKQILDMRQRQKEIADERMKAKLRAKRKERETGTAWEES